MESRPRSGDMNPNSKERVSGHQWRGYSTNSRSGRMVSYRKNVLNGKVHDGIEPVHQGTNFEIPGMKGSSFLSRTLEAASKPEREEKE
jgi:hypothetical protein